MLIMDAVAATAAQVTPLDHPLVQIFPDLVRRMRLAPRYLLDATVMQASIELGLGRPTVFREALRHLRIPYLSLWVEWEEANRESLRARLAEEPADPLKPIPKRLGYLLEADPTGRRGTITWAWLTEDVGVPNISPFDCHFDFDATTEQPADRTEGLLRANLAKLWLDNPVQLPALLDIWCTSDHQPSEWGRTLLRGSNERFFLTDVYGEYLGALAVLLLLTASRPTVTYREVDRSRLNRARAKRQDLALLDHTEVTMHINHEEVVASRRMSLGYQRRSPRLHQVGSYLARRGDKHWITRPYIRGSGSAVERHVRVTR